MNKSIKHLFFLIVMFGLFSACYRENRIQNNQPKWPQGPDISYDFEPNTPEQWVLDSLANMHYDSLDKTFVTIDKYNQNYFHTIENHAFSGWAKQVFLDNNHRYRYFRIDSGWISWQIGYYENGALDHDFHSLNGRRHGSQRMWREDGTPYIHNYSLMNKPHGRQRRWYANGQLARDAYYENDSLIKELFYNELGRISKMNGEFQMPIADTLIHKNGFYRSLTAHGVIHSYLHFFFEKSSEKKNLNSTSRHLCHFEQYFADSAIRFEMNSCSASSNFILLDLPPISISNAKKWLHSLFQPYNEEDTYKWTPDTLYYTDAGHKKAAGCDFHFEQKKDGMNIKIYCAD